MDPAEQSMADKFDDDDYPAYTMGRAAEMLGTTPGFLRSLDEAKLITPQRSPGGHRRYSAPASSSARAHPWTPPAASSSSKTNSPKPNDSTPRSTKTTDTNTHADDTSPKHEIELPSGGPGREDTPPGH
jgi:hypothetical protein